MACIALGWNGDLKGGKATAEKLSPEELSEQGRNAVMARWTKYFAEKEEKERKGK